MHSIIYIRVFSPNTCLALDPCGPRLFWHLHPCDFAKERPILGRLGGDRYHTVCTTRVGSGLCNQTI